MIDYPEDQLRRGRWLMWMAITWLLWTSLYDLSLHYRRLDRAIIPDQDISELVEQIERRCQRDDLSSREGP